VRAQQFDPSSPSRRTIYRAPLIYIRAAEYDAQETSGLSVHELLERGLPNRLQVELGWYAGVRRPDGRLGNNYVLLPRAASYYSTQADHGATEDWLLEFLYLKRSCATTPRSPSASRAARRCAGRTSRRAT
jgi:hypothetical protein